MKILGPDSTFTGNVLVAGSIGNQDSGVFVAFPDGGSYENTNSSITGAIKVTLPNSWISTMMQFEVSVWDYATNESFTVVIAGYAYNDATNPRWLNTTCYILGKNINRDYTIRFGHDGTKCCVYIGELTSTWSYLGIRVKNFQGSFNNDTFDLWKAGWVVSIEATAFGTVSSTLSDNFVISSYAKNADTLDGKDSTEFALSTHTHPATMITEDSTHRFVTDADKTSWNAKESSTVESRTSLTLENSWIHYGTPWSEPFYYKDRERVYLSGVLKGGAVNSIVTTLPTGYRPPATIIRPIATDTGYGYVRIYSDGRIQYMSGGTVFISLDSLDFRI